MGKILRQCPANERRVEEVTKLGVKTEVHHNEVPGRNPTCVGLQPRGQVLYPYELVPVNVKKPEIIFSYFITVPRTPYHVNWCICPPGY